MTGPRPVIAAMTARTGFPASRSPALDPRPLPPHACSLPCPLQCHLAGQPRHVDIPRRITARQLHATTGGGAIVEEHDRADRSEEHTSEQSRENLVCRLLLEKKKSIE